jgi:putative membrane protein
LKKRKGAIMSSLLSIKDILIQWGGYDRYGGGYGPGMMNWGYGGWFMGIINIIFWIAVIIGIIYLIKFISSSSKQSTQESKRGDSALDILRERYAKGEINREEFEEKKKVLKE